MKRILKPFIAAMMAAMLIAPRAIADQMTNKGGSGGGGGVTKIIAGTNVTISPSGGTGNVTVNATGGGGGSSSPITLFPAANGVVPPVPYNGSLLSKASQLVANPLGYGGTGAPFGINMTVGQDGKIYISDSANNQIVVYNPANTTSTNYATTTPSANPFGVCLGPDKRVWFSELVANNIAAIDIAGTITEYPVTTPSANPAAICSDGTNLWFIEAVANKICKITPSGVVTEYAIPTSASSSGYGICLGGDRKIYFTEATGNNIGRVDTATGAVTEIAVPTGGCYPAACVAAADGNVWFTEYAANKVAKIDPAGAITEYSPGVTSPGGITSGPDGLLYLAQADSAVAINLLGNLVTPNITATGLTSAGGFTNGPDESFYWLNLTSLMKVPFHAPQMVAGSGITITPNSNGQQAIASTSGASIGYFVPNISNPTTNTVLTAASTDVQNCGDNQIDLTLPLAATCPGKRFKGWCRSNGQSSFSAAGSDTVGNFSGNSNASITFGAGGTNNLPGFVEIESNGVSAWKVIDAGADFSSTNAGFATTSGGGLRMTSVRLTSGISTLSSGTVTISDSTISASSVIVATLDGGTALGEELTIVKTAGVGFQIISTNITSTAVVDWIRFN